MKHRLRKSFKKWAMKGQRVMTEDMEVLEARRGKSHRPFMVGRPFKNYGRLRFGDELTKY
jgi:hypothetical protein